MNKINRYGTRYHVSITRIPNENLENRDSQDKEEML